MQGYEIRLAPADAVVLAAQLLADTAAATAGTQTQSEALRAALAAVGERMGWSLGEVWLPADRASLERCCYWAAPNCPAAAAFEPRQKEASVTLPPSICERLLDRREPLVCDGETDDSGLFRIDRMGPAGLRRACALPISRGDSVVAVLVFFASAGTDPSTVPLDTVAAALAPLSGHIERLQVESELAARNRHLALMLRNTQTATFELDIADNVIRWDSAMSRILGFPDDRTTLDFADVAARFHPDDVDEALEAVDVSVRSCGLLHVEHRIMRPDGAVRWLLIRGATICDADGAPQRLVGICWDETDSRRDSDRLEMLARFHDEYPEPVFRLAHDGSICDANSAAEPFLEDLGAGCEAELPGPIRAMVEDVRATGRKLSSNVRLDSRIFHVTLIPAPDSAYINVYATDVTRLHRSQEAMQQATKMEAVGQLAGGVAHDFNNRLTVILGNLELLEESCAGEELALLQEARQAAENSSVLARKLLSISRPQQVEYRPTEVNAVVRNLATLLDRCLGVDMDLALELNPAPLDALLDSTELEDVLLNLTLNARDAMHANGRLTIESDTVYLAEEDLVGKPGLAAGEHVVISVSDTGHGMPARVRAHAFEPYFTDQGQAGHGAGPEHRLYAGAQVARSRVDLQRGGRRYLHPHLRAESECRRGRRTAPVADAHLAQGPDGRRRPAGRTARVAGRGRRRDPPPGYPRACLAGLRGDAGGRCRRGGAHPALGPAGRRAAHRPVPAGRARRRGARQNGAGIAPRPAHPDRLRLHAGGPAARRALPRHPGGRLAVRRQAVFVRQPRPGAAPGCDARRRQRRGTRRRCKARGVGPCSAAKYSSSMTTRPSAVSWRGSAGTRASRRSSGPTVPISKPSCRVAG
ncbi:MAG: PAS domain-containing protein [Woeseiaceae bacterium]|nr:PAS domain-containing protein [Woeseiaceae bacterium]